MVLTMRGLIIRTVGVVVCIVLGVCLAGPSDCKDKYSVADCWFTLHKCNEAGYQGVCKKSCGICDNCKDLQNAKYCWDNVHRCKENYYQKNCKKTCGLCDGCADIRNDCSSRTTQCGDTWIIIGCRKTCWACHIQDTGGRETDDTMTTTTSTHAERTIEKDNQENPNQVGNWGAWGPWGLCSATCGKGETSRWRTCSPAGTECPGDNTETTDCHLTDCCVPRDGTWGDWSDWSTCSYTCGGGSRTKTRKCNEPNACGQPCQGKSYESTACNVQQCPRQPAVPSITTDPPTSLFSAGVTVTLTCSSLDLGSPPATLTWVTSIQGTRTTRVNNQRIQLQILNLSVEYDGLSVKCLANNMVSENVVLRVDQKASYGECRASVSSSTWQVTGYCDITQVFSSNNQYQCYWYEVKGSERENIPSSFNRSLITPGRKLQKGKCGFQTKIPDDFPQVRERSRELKYRMYFNPGGTWLPIINVTIVSPKAPTITCPADVTEGSHMNCTCSTSDVGEPGGRLLLFSNDRLENTGQYGQKVIILSRDARREDNNVRVSCRLHWARNMSADRDWTLRVLYPPEMPSLLIGGRTTVNYTTNVHSSVHFTCRVGPSIVHSLELLKVTRNGSQIVQDLSTSSSSFRIQKAGCADSGTYYCRAGNTMGQNNSMLVKLNVLCSPGLVNGSSARTKQLKVTEGSNGQLTFEVTGYPVPNIVGVSYHQGKNMSKEEPVRADLLTVECKQNTPDVHLATCTLSIADATYTDNGMYNVHLSNSQGTIHVPVELIVDTQDSSDNASSLSWIGIVITLLIIIVIGVLIVFFVRRRRAAQTKTSENKKKISSTVTARRNLEDPVYYNVTVADVTMPSSAATMTSGTFNIRNCSVALTSPNENAYFNYEKKTSLKDRGESSTGTTSDDSPQDNLYALVDKTQKSSSSENTGKPPKPAPMPKPKRSGSASRKSAENGGTGQSQNDSLVQESGDLLHPTNEAAGPNTTQNTTDNEEGLFYTELDFSQHRPQSKRPLPQKEETNYAAIDFKLQK